MSQSGKSAKKSKKPPRDSGHIKADLEITEARPMTKNQGRAFDAWEDGKHLFNHGYAGTGKTFVALYLALKSIRDREFRKLYVVRSAVPTRDMGFLPGNAREKAEAYEGPYKAICTDLYGRGDAYEILKQKGVIEFITTSYVRGVTLDDCIVFVDEIQNLSFHELDSVITRTGEGTRLIFSGDVTQTDFVRDVEKNGLKQFMKIVDELNSFEFIEYGIGDIVRSDVVRDYIIAKDRLGAQ